MIRDEAGEATDVRYLDANPAAHRLIDDEIDGRRLNDIAEGFAPERWQLPDRVLDSGEPERAELFAEPLEQWFEVGVTKVDEGRVAILFQDITERKRHEEERELMMGELNHRVKNMLAVVQSVAGQTLRTTDDMQVFVETFQQRVEALARAQGLLTQEHWLGADLRELAQAALGSFVGGGDRFRIGGLPVRLSPNAAISFAMALNEVGTNGMKEE